ncbi:cyclin [Desmophyllum pertusum]|uniref:Cyclin n=1 Tax=Desmophyllum pertusum TaxID=174260 RepID=A0A9W9Y9U2_9CNID|nr:cyclin [Desmophyllum pertusum]
MKILLLLQAAFANIETLTLARFPSVNRHFLESCFVTNMSIIQGCFMSSTLPLMAMNNCGKWTPTLVHYTGYIKDELPDCVLQLTQ